MKKLLVPPTQLVMDVPSLHHMGTCTHTPRAQEPAIARTDTSQLLDPSSWEKQNVLVSRRTSEAWTYISWLMVKADCCFCPWQECLWGPCPTRDPPPKRVSAMPGAADACCLAPPVSKVLLTRRFSLVFQILEGISPEAAIHTSTQAPSVSQAHLPLILLYP